ncbi:MAG: type secretion system baseplate subunit TssE [Rhodoferax sp.]|nr:type secretion system baseplate subunit TssE [Rhodoferax sp.]
MTPVEDDKDAEDAQDVESVEGASPGDPTQPEAGTEARPGSAAARHHPAARSLPSSRSGQAKPWQNQFLPTLFDRLCDDAPQRSKELSSEYAPSRSGMRGIVQRDLTFLLNTTNQQDLLDPDLHAEVLTSTVNYGVPALAGSYLSDRKWADIEKMIRKAIVDFEPRLLPDSIFVRPLMKEDGRASYNVLLFEIRATLHMEPYPVEFTVQSAVDLETSRITLE